MLLILYKGDGYGLEGTWEGLWDADNVLLPSLGASSTGVFTLWLYLWTVHWKYLHVSICMLSFNSLLIKYLLNAWDRAMWVFLINCFSNITIVLVNAHYYMSWKTLEWQNNGDNILIIMCHLPCHENLHIFLPTS